MEISDVRVRVVRESTDRLKAVCSVTLDDEFVVRDVKVVEGTHGLFVAMPSRKLSVPCPRCRTQNHVRAKFCNECGTKLPVAHVPADPDGREKAHRDIAHPITPAFRKTIQERVLEAYRIERERAEDVDDSSGTYETELDTNEGSDEYNTLIADLRNGEEIDETRGNARDAPRRGEGSGESDRDRSRGRRGRGRGRGRGERRTEDAERGGRPAAPAAVVAESQSRRDSSAVPRDRDRTTRPPSVEPPARRSEPPARRDGPPVDEVAPSVDHEAARDTGDEEDDDSPFGEGIL